MNWKAWLKTVVAAAAGAGLATAAQAVPAWQQSKYAPAIAAGLAVAAAYGAKSPWVREVIQVISGPGTEEKK